MIWMVVVGSFALTGLTWYYGELNYDRGYKARMAENVEQVEDALSSSRQERDEALQVVEQLRSRKPAIIYKRIPQVVERSDCKRLGDGFVQLFNRIHQTSDPGRVPADVRAGEHTGR